jgi:hypothetical protein
MSDVEDTNPEKAQQLPSVRHQRLALTGRWVESVGTVLVVLGFLVFGLGVFGYFISIDNGDAFRVTLSYLAGGAVAGVNFGTAGGLLIILGQGAKLAVETADDVYRCADAAAAYMQEE